MSLKSPKLSLAALGSRRLAPGEQGSLLRSRLYDVCPAMNEDGHTAGSALEPGMQSGGEDQKTTKAELHDLIASCLGLCAGPLTVPAKMPSGVEYASESWGGAWTRKEAWEKSHKTMSKVREMSVTTWANVSNQKRPRQTTLTVSLLNKRGAELPTDACGCPPCPGHSPALREVTRDIPPSPKQLRGREKCPRPHGYRWQSWDSEPCFPVFHYLLS